jgi:hypothetical protein
MDLRCIRLIHDVPDRMTFSQSPQQISTRYEVSPSHSSCVTLLDEAPGKEDVHSLIHPVGKVAKYNAGTQN